MNTLIASRPQTNTSPEFKGIKTSLFDLVGWLAKTNTSPEFKGIKTSFSHVPYEPVKQIPALNSKGLIPVFPFQPAAGANKYQP